MTPSGPQSYLPEQQQGIFTPKKTPEQECIDKGGKWNGSKCIMPSEEVKKEVKAKEIKQDTGFQIGNEVVSEKEYYRIKSLLPGAEGGSRGELVSEEDRETAAALDVTPEQRAAEEEQAALQAHPPERRELDPYVTELEKKPVYGPILTSIKDVMTDVFLSKDFREKYGDRQGFSRYDLKPEELRTLALTQIEKNEIEAGLTRSELFGSYMESLSLGGLSDFIAEKPSENVQTILKELKTEKTRATNAEIKVKDGTWRKEYGEEVITEIDSNIQRMESRIKMLIQNSPELKFNSDGVNFIELKIYEARERLFAAKINMVTGATKDPTDIEILLSLQESIQQEDFTIE